MPTRIRVQKTFCTTREAAQILGISLRTAQLWSESGLLEAWKTAGGHRRISRQSVDRLLANPRGKPSGDMGENKRTAQVTPPSERLNSEPGQTALSLRAFSILIVEDEANVRHLYEIALARWPMAPRVVTVADGCSGLVRLGLDRPDMLISDLRMPGVDGFHMLRILCAMPELAQTAIVVVTDLDASDILARGGLPDGISVLPKPIPFDRLREIAEARFWRGATGEADGQP